MTASELTAAPIIELFSAINGCSENLRCPLGELQNIVGVEYEEATTHR